MSHVISPQVDSEGNYLGSEVQTRSEGLWKGDQGFVQSDQGQTLHAFQDVELEDEIYQDGGFDMDSYTEALQQIHPDMSDAIAWAATGAAHGFDAIGFNDAVQAQDLNGINAGLEQLLGMYYESLTPEPEPQQQQQEDLNEEDLDDEEFEDDSDEITQEYVNNEVERLRETTYTEEQVEVMAAAAQQYGEGSVERFILQLGTSIGNGELTFDQALQYATENVDEGQLISAYTQLVRQLN